MFEKIIVQPEFVCQATQAVREWTKASAILEMEEEKRAQMERVLQLGRVLGDCVDHTGRRKDSVTDPLAKEFARGLHEAYLFAWNEVLALTIKRQASPRAQRDAEDAHLDDVGE